MKLSTLLAPWMVLNTDCDILNLQHDSRLVKPGDLFLAYPGHVVDGRAFIADALAKGAEAVLYEPANLPPDILHPGDSADAICIPISDLSMKRGLIASRFYGEPTRAFSVIGVTGTNGKTTIAYQLAQAYERLGLTSAYLGTLGQGPVSDIKPIKHTTPEPLALQHFFYESKLRDPAIMCMEVSSHALAQGRVAGIEFTQAIFTNLTHEHLDYHKTMQGYAEAKALLFAMPTLKWAIINADDAYGAIMSEQARGECNILTYGIDTPCDVRAADIVMTMRGTSFTVISPWGCFSVQVKLIGLFNIYNSLAVIGSLLAAGFSSQQVVDVMRELKPSPGRMEIVHENPCVIIDYAHTPDALENVLLTLEQLKQRELHVVFGCGGDRDKTKRPMMGEIASRYANHLVITSDNPRTEEPVTIIDDIVQGINSSQIKTIDPDRKHAIYKTLHMAHPDDLILIAGKGHEDYQEIGKTRFPFSDQDVVRSFYQNLDLP